MAKQKDMKKRKDKSIKDKTSLKEEIKEYLVKNKNRLKNIKHIKLIDKDFLKVSKLFLIVAAGAYFALYLEQLEIRSPHIGIIALILMVVVLIVAVKLEKFCE